MALLTGTLGPDTLIGTPGADEIHGFAGDDTLEGGDGDDRIFGGAGNDILRGGAGNDRLDGGSGVNILEGGEGDDDLILNGGGGSFSGGDGYDRLVLNTLVHMLDLGAGTITGAGFTGTVTGIEEVVLGDNIERFAFSWIYGTEGDDRLATTYRAYGRGGNDVLTLLSTQRFDEDRFFANVLDGGEGDDLLRYSRHASLANSSLGGTDIDGGPGWDVLAYGTLTSEEVASLQIVKFYHGVSVNLEQGTGSLLRAEGSSSGTFQDDWITGIEGVIGTAFNDILYGDANDNSLDGAAGDDRIHGGAGNDSLNGGDGYDWLLLEGATATTYVDLSAGFARDGLGGTDTVSGFEAVLGSDQDDTIIGSDAAETLVGGLGRDTLRGGGGEDRLEGGDGDDTLEGGAGDDTLVGGLGDDLLDGGDAFDSVLMEELGFRGSARDLSPQGLLRLTTAEGTDTITQVEEVRFLDGRLVLDADSNEAAVARLYSMTLGRQAEVLGLSYWADRLAGGESLDTVAGGIIASDEFAALHGRPEDEAAFVDMLYTSILDRNADAAGTAYWNGLLAGGTSRGSVVASFSESGENRALTADEITLGIWRVDQDAALVARLYDTLLGRAPDAAGLVGFTAVAKSAGWASVAQAMLGSAEYAANVGPLGDTIYVASLYSEGLNRQAGQAEVAFWTAALASGQSRAEVAHAISESAEHVALMRPVIDDGILIG